MNVEEKQTILALHGWEIRERELSEWAQPGQQYQVYDVWSGGFWRTDVFYDGKKRAIHAAYARLRWETPGLPK